MARVAVAMSCTEDVKAQFERLSRSRNGEVRMAERARIVLACLAGKRNDEVASKMGVRPNMGVSVWPSRIDTSSAVVAKRGAVTVFETASDGAAIVQSD